MAAIVRVKRSRTDNAADTIVVSCKKVKLDKDFDFTTSEHLKGTFKFAATVNKESDEVTKCVKEAIKREKIQRDLRHHSTTAGILQKARGCHKQQIVSNRFKLVAEKRAVELNELDPPTKESRSDETPEAKPSNGVTDPSATASESEYRFRLLDVAKDNTSNMTLAPPPEPEKREEVVTCNGVPMTREKVTAPPTEPADFVYDIYYLNQSDFDFRALENILAIEATQEEFVYDDYRDEDGEVYDDEDDPDDENNWRNDYPDEDPQYVENWDKHYEYDELGGTGYSFDDWGASQMLKDRLKFTEDDISEGASLSSEEEDHAYFNDPMHPVQLGTALESYDRYKERVSKQLEEDGS